MKRKILTAILCFLMPAILTQNVNARKLPELPYNFLYCTKDDYEEIRILYLNLNLRNKKLLIEYIRNHMKQESKSDLLAQSSKEIKYIINKIKNTDVKDYLLVRLKFVSVYGIRNKIYYTIMHVNDFNATKNEMRQSNHLMCREKALLFLPF